MAAAALVAGVLLLGLLPTTPAAAAAPGLQFLDPRPIVVDLDDLPDDLRWRVQVFQGQGGDPVTLRMHVLFQPAGVIAVEEPEIGPLATGEIGSFVIALRDASAGAGELVVTSSDGAVARREIRTGRPADETGPLPSRLQFTGTRLSPLGGRVRVGDVDAPATPGYATQPVRLGSIVSGDGDVADVVRDGDTFHVRGIDGPGQYAGKVDLLPGSDAGDTDVIATVRDAAGWPLMVLVLGLLAVQGIERYQKRTRPRRNLARRLAFLFERARAAQDRVRGRMRITGGGGSELFLDGAAKDALAAWDRARTDAEWSAWDVGGASYQRIEKAVDAFKLLTDDVVRLEEERDRLLDEVRAQDRAAARRALEEAPVGDALRPASFATAEEIGRAAELVAEGRRHLDRLGNLYDDLADLEAADVPTAIREAAADLRAKLLRVRDLDPVEAKTEELLETWLASGPRPVTPAARLAPRSVPMAAPAATPPRPPLPGSAAPPPGAEAVRRSRRRPVGPALAALAAVGVFVVGALLSLGNNASVDPGDPPPPSATTATTAPLPDAPVAPAPTPPRAGDHGDIPRAGDVGDIPGGAAVFGWGLVFPILLGAAALLAVDRAVRAWRRRRPKVAEDFDSSRLDRMLREEDLRFGLASGMFVVASGMSLLYVPDATFGSAGDYLAVALWGTVVGEGVQLARRLLPLPG